MEDTARMPTDAERRPPGSDQPHQRKPKPERSTRGGEASLPDSPATSATKPRKAPPPAAAPVAAPASSAPAAPASPAAPAAPAALTTPAPVIQRKLEIETRPMRPPPPAPVIQRKPEIEAKPVLPAPPAAPQPDTPAAYASHIDVDALTQNFARLVEEGGRAIAAYLKPREEHTTKISYSDQVADAVKALGQVMEYWYADPQRAVEMQARLG